MFAFLYVRALACPSLPSKKKETFPFINISPIPAGPLRKFCPETFAHAQRASGHDKFASQKRKDNSDSGDGVFFLFLSLWAVTFYVNNARNANMRKTCFGGGKNQGLDRSIKKNEGHRIEESKR